MERAGLKPAFAPSGDREILLCIVAQVKVLLVCFAIVGDVRLRATLRARDIIRYGGATNTIDLDEAGRPRIAPYHFPDASTEEVANHPLLLMLSFTRPRMSQADAIR